jgi:hypothetical protein
MTVYAPFFAYTSAGNSATIAVATSSGLQILPEKAPQILLTNLGTQTVYVRLNQGEANQAATANDVCIRASSSLLLSKGNCVNMTHISPGGASTLHFACGEGANSI